MRFGAYSRQPFPDRYERVARNSGEIDKVEGRARWIAKLWRGLDPARHSILRASLVSWVPSPALKILLPSWLPILMLAVSLVLSRF